MGLTDQEYDLILKLLGREPTMTELGMISVMWSEHCGYKYSRPILSYFSEYKKAMEGDGHENAGMINIGNNIGVVMKVESHNHPSAVEPHQGAATGVGGIIRDIFTMGARPIACLNSLRFGPIRDGEADEEVVSFSKHIFEGVVDGISRYGNCVGVPTIAGEVAFHRRYAGNPLVNAMCVGMVDLDEVASAGADGPGNPVIYLGSATGKDGIHGATFASDALNEDSESQRPNVQIGDPFAEKIVIEATLEALKTGAVQSIQDMGAAGLTCSTTEMAGKGNVGMDVDLDKVPMREDDMTAYELMLSESQERMLAIAHKGREQEIIDIFHKWGTQAEVIGYLNDTGMVTISRHGKVEADFPAKLLTDECPTYVVEPVEPQNCIDARTFSLDTVEQTDPQDSLFKLLSCPTLASKRWVYQQYDQQVQTQTTLLPGQGDAAVLAPRGTRKGVALKIDGSGLWTMQDPYAGGCLAVIEAARNVACTGAKPVGVTDGLNFGDPRDPGVYFQFERAVRGIADAAEALGAPVISGNVSFYNQSELGEVLPTPLIGMMGLLEDANKRIGMALPENACKIGLVKLPVEAGSQLGLGASTYLTEVHKREEGAPIRPNLRAEKDLCHWLADSVNDELLLCAHDVSEGGTVFALAEMCIAGDSGCEVDLSGALSELGSRIDAVAFGEIPGHVVVGFESDSEQALRDKLPNGLTLTVIGDSAPDSGQVKATFNGQTLVDSQTSDLKDAYESAIPGCMD